MTAMEKSINHRYNTTSGLKSRTSVWRGPIRVVKHSNTVNRWSPCAKLQHAILGARRHAIPEGVNGRWLSWNSCHLRETKGVWVQWYRITRERLEKILTSSIALPIQSRLNSIPYSCFNRRTTASRTILYPIFSANSTPRTRRAPARKAQIMNFPSAAPRSQTTPPLTRRLSKISLVETALILPFTPLILPSAPPAVTDLKIAKTRLNLWTSDSVLQSTGALHLRDVLVFFFFAIPKRAPHCSDYGKIGKSRICWRKKRRYQMFRMVFEYKKIISYLRHGWFRFNNFNFRNRSESNQFHPAQNQCVSVQEEHILHKAK